MLRWIAMLLKLLALILSYIMVAVVSLNYGIMLECIRRGACSAPAEVAFLQGLPWLIALVLAWFLGRYYDKKYQLEKKG